MKNTTIKAVVFDMGGVFVRLGPISEVIGEEDLSVEEFWTGWLSSPVVRSFERGRCSAEVFGEAIVKELGLAMSGEEFIARFVQWPKGFYPGAESLLRSLKEGGMPISVLSNTNALHWNKQIDHELITDLFDVQFTSYSIDMVKPDAEIFEYVVSKLDVAPEHILFLDDNQPNIDGADAVGIHAVRTRGIDEVRVALESFGLL